MAIYAIIEGYFIANKNFNKFNDLEYIMSMEDETEINQLSQELNSLFTEFRNKFGLRTRRKSYFLFF